MELASLIIGIASIVCLVASFLINPNALVLSGLLGLIGFVIGWIATIRYNKSAGFILSIVSLFITIFIIFLMAEAEYYG